MTSEGTWSQKDKDILESQLVLATAEPICLDPNPEIGIRTINEQTRRCIFNTQKMKRQMKKYSQVSINRKRKTDQFTHYFGLELSDFLQKYRTRPRQYPAKRTVNSFTLPKKPTEVIKMIQTPNLELPEILEVPAEVDVSKYARAYDRLRETKDCIPQLIKEYQLQTDAANGGKYLVKLSIYQRPSNSEYLGELYVDHNYKKDERNGKACQFVLYTLAHANRYIQQFTEIFTEEGRKPVQIICTIPGQKPQITNTKGIQDAQPLQQPQPQQQPTQIQNNNQTTQQVPPQQIPQQLQIQRQNSHLLQTQIPCKPPELLLQTQQPQNPQNQQLPNAQSQSPIRATLVDPQNQLRTQFIQQNVQQIIQQQQQQRIIASSMGQPPNLTRLPNVSQTNTLLGNQIITTPSATLIMPQSQQQQLQKTPTLINQLNMTKNSSQDEDQMNQMMPALTPTFVTPTQPPPLQQQTKTQQKNHSELNQITNLVLVQASPLTSNAQVLANGSRSFSLTVSISFQYFYM
jgi:hypothetical protein